MYYILYMFNISVMFNIYKYINNYNIYVKHT